MAIVAIEKTEEKGEVREVVPGAWGEEVFVVVDSLVDSEESESLREEVAAIRGVVCVCVCVCLFVCWCYYNVLFLQQLCESI